MTHLLGIVGILYVAFLHFSWLTIGLGTLWFFLCMFSTTGGYHRLFAHKAYKASAPLRLFYLLFGAASGQASILNWAADHRVHHATTDSDDDPYNIRKGFWWAHIGWLFFRDPVARERKVSDLEASALIRFQHRFYVLLLLGVGFLAPLLIAASWGDAVGGFLVAGFVRLMFQYHATFSINSVAHFIGRRPYSTSVSARDSAIAAILTLGEGYHNYHHRFPGDYRNGIRFYHYDPTKWCVWVASKVGLASDLKRVSEADIEKARDAVRRSPPV
jgi:stearoyl-CoA desaturase (delta-9 desaturase)